MVLTALLLQFGCSADGNETSATATVTATMSMPTTLSTLSESGTGTTAGTVTDSGTTAGNSATDGSSTSPEPTGGTTVDPTATTQGEMTSVSSTTMQVDPSVSSTTGEPPCDVVKATLKPVVPNMMLVLDKSGSMVADPAGYWDHDADAATPKITRWNSLYQTVQSIVNDFNDSINFGANLFPGKAAKAVYDPGACIVNANVEIPVAPKNKDAVLNGIPQAGDISIRGGTPTFRGITAALNHLKTLDPAVPRAMLLLTDGAANCIEGAGVPGNYAPLFEVYDQALHTLVADAWTKDGIPTYVVGIDTKNEVSNNTNDGNPNSTNTYTKLNELALDGGKPKDDPVEKFYNAANQIQLKDALDAIAKDAISCVIPIDEEPGAPEKTKVLVGGVEVPMVMDCAVENGWVYTNPMGPYDAIELCGTACGDLKIVKEADVEFYCVAG
ncbi:MAG: VWA domain-containing protein [Nannocystis sp.]|nr:vWA domain-containing protein [Nannocystis sp.]MBA3545942.1 VWA domain-containing protein [Nannocystis sp.]